tara:strand:- start:90 stop:359 length:270 start_codon:yes stop_codon:yes gene_type:complete
MEEVTFNTWIIDTALAVLGAAIFGLFGFVWKTSHKVSGLEKNIDALRQMHSRDITETRRDIDMICSNVDKNREWTTNRMMSIAKEMPRD